MQVPGPVQSDFQRFLNVGSAGMPAQATNWSVDTKICQTAAGIGFGLAVSQSLGSDRGVDLGNPSGSAFVGISARDITKFVASQADADVYALYDSMAVAVLGDWWVTVGDDVTPETVVIFSDTTGQLGLSGTTIHDARWLTSASAGGLAVLRLGNLAGGMN